MLESSIWISLFLAVVATVATRASGPFVARLSLLKRIKEETLARLFPLAILFCLVFKEVADGWSAANSSLAFVKVGAVIGVVILHLWRRNLFISVIGGTALYVICLRVFTLG